MTTDQFTNILLSVLGFIGSLSVLALISIAKSVNDIKVFVGIITAKHEALEKRVDKLEDDK